MTTMNTSSSQSTLSDRFKHAPSMSALSARSQPHASDPSLSGLSSIELLTGKGQLFPGFNSFPIYRSQDSVLSSESSQSDRQQFLDGDSVDECDAGDFSELAGDGSFAVCSDGDCEDSRDSFHLNMTVRELIDTERIYVKDLRDVVFGYMQNILRAGIMSRDNFHDLFGNIRAIFEFNRNFLSHLQKNFGDPTKIAECFVELHNDFIIYSDYCTNYPRSLKVLEQLMKDSKFVAVLKKEQMKLQHPLPLETYLFKPVQRILKYHLLLKSMQSDFLYDTPGREVIDTAVERMVNIALYINEMKRRHERLMRTQELQNMISGTQRIDLGSYGDLVLEDMFRLSGLWGDRLVLLFCKALVMTKKRKDGSMQIKLVIRTSNLMIIESVPREPLLFHIYPCDSPKSKYTLQAKTLEQKQIWCQEIKSLIMDNFPTNIPEHAKQIVLGRPSVDCNSSQKNGSNSPATLARRIYKSMTPEMKAEQIERRRSTGAIPKHDDMDDTMTAGTGDSSLDDEAAEAAAEMLLTSDREENQGETVLEDSCDVERSSPAIGRRSQSLDYLYGKAGANSSAGTNGVTLNSGTANDSVESSESEADDGKSTSDSSCSADCTESSSKVRVIPIRAESFKQAMQMEPIELNIQHRKSTLEDVFEDTVSGTEDSLLRPKNPVVMRNASRTSSSSSENATKRMSRLFDEWDPSVLDNISNMHDLFKSWPTFNDTTAMFSPSHFMPFNGSKVPEFTSLNHPSFSRFSCTEPITSFRDELIGRQMSVPLAHHRSSLNTRSMRGATSALGQNQPTSSCYRVPIRIINSDSSADPTSRNVNVTVDSAVSRGSVLVDSMKADGLPVKISHSVSVDTVKTDGSHLKVVHSVPVATVKTDGSPVKVSHSVPVDAVKTIGSPVKVSYRVPVDIVKTDGLPVTISQSVPVDTVRTDGLPVKVSHSVPVDTVRTDGLPVQIVRSVPTDKDKYNDLQVKVLHNVTVNTVKTDNIPVKVSYNVPVDNDKVLRNVPVKVHFSIPVSVAISPSPPNRVPIVVNTCSSASPLDKLDTLPRWVQPSQSSLHMDHRIIPVQYVQSGTTEELDVKQGNVEKKYASDEFDGDNKHVNMFTDVHHDSDVQCDVKDQCTFDDSDEDALKKILQEMTVKHQTIRETVSKINLKTSRSMDGIDGCVAANDSQPVQLGKSKLSGDLVKKRVNLFQGEFS